MTTVVSHIAAALSAAGTRTVWGMPGGDTLPLLDALSEGGLDFVLVRDEASAGFAASASAQLVGAPGACVATVGPGFAKLLGGVAGAYLDRSPVIALTSRLRTAAHASQTHMVLDQTQMMAATAKAHFRITPENVGHELRRALAIANAPRQGPVWLEVPTEAALATSGHARPLPPPVAPAPVVSPAAIVAEVRSWRRPAVLVGFGGRHAPIEALATALRAPVLTTYKAKGAIPEATSPWWAGSASLSPVVDRVHQAHLDGCDGVLLVGWDPVELREHWMPGWPAAARVVVLDDHVVTDLPSAVHALAVGPVPALVAALVGEGASDWSEAEVASWRDAWQGPFEDGADGPATALRAVQAAVADAVVTLDTGAHRITASQVWRCQQPDQLLQSNGFASMGYAIPAALAAAALGRRAVAITGDMGLQMVQGELMVAAERGWPLVVVVLDDQELALISLKQRRLSLPARGVTFRNPDWAAVGASVYGRGRTARGADEITAAVREGLASPGVTLVAVQIDPAAYLRQM